MAGALRRLFVLAGIAFFDPLALLRLVWRFGLRIERQFHEAGSSGVSHVGRVPIGSLRCCSAGGCEQGQRRSRNQHFQHGHPLDCTVKTGTSVSAWTCLPKSNRCTSDAGDRGAAQAGQERDTYYAELALSVAANLARTRAAIVGSTRTVMAMRPLVTSATLWMTSVWRCSQLTPAPSAGPSSSSISTRPAPRRASMAAARSASPSPVTA